MKNLGGCDILCLRSNKIIFIRYNDIIFLEEMRGRIDIYTQSISSLAGRIKLGTVNGRLSDPNSFDELTSILESEK
jgi:hypothetical protein